MQDKSIWILSIVCLLTALLSSCGDDVTSAGSSSLSEGEDVLVCADTLRNIASYISEAQPIYNTPDSFLVGECQSLDYGTLKANLLTQLACPEGWTYPESSEVDSVCIYLYYTSWYGDGKAPLGLKVYELDGEPLSYDSVYSSNVALSRFCSRDKAKCMTAHDVVVAAAYPSDSVYSSSLKKYVPFVRMRLSDTYAQKLFAIRDFSSQSAFNRQFNGMLITTSFGSASALYINSLCVTIHYHFTKTSADGKPVTYTDNKVFYANSEVKQVNRYEYADRATVMETLKQNESFNYVVSPANIYAHINIPTKDIVQRIQEGVQYRRPYVNMAKLNVEVLNTEDATKDGNWGEPAPTMMLVREDAFNDVFRKHELPADTMAVYTSITSRYNADSTAYRFFYSFDMATIITRMVRNNASDTLRMLLVPVDLTYSGSSNATFVSSIRVKQSASVTKIRSAYDLSEPMDIEVVYCGFTDKQILQ